jgi:hypothetical protein
VCGGSVLAVVSFVKAVLAVLAMAVGVAVVAGLS